MSKVINDQKLHAVVGDYLKGTDFSKPLVIFGHPGSGKTEITRRVADAMNKVPFNLVDETDLDELAESLNTFDKDKMFIEVSITSTDNAEEIIRQLLGLNAAVPMIIEVTTECEGQCRRVVPSFADDMIWYYNRRTTEDFIRWARMPGKDGKRNLDIAIIEALEANPESICPHNNYEKELYDTAMEIIDSIESDLQNNKMSEACNKMKDAIGRLLAATIDDDFIQDKVHGFIDLLSKYRNTCGMEGDVIATRTVLGFTKIPYINLSENEN